jgi:hypothetical protein
LLFFTCSIFLLDYLLKIAGLERHNAALIAFLVSLPLSIYGASVAYSLLWPEFFKRAETNAKQRLEKYDDE